MRRDARRPQRAGDIEFAHEPVDAETLLQIAQLVLLRHSGEAHRVFVERCEYDTVDVAALRRVGRDRKRSQRRAAAIDRCATRRDGGRRDQVDCNERRTAGDERELVRSARQRFNRAARDALARFEYFRIGVDGDVGVRERIRSRKQFDGDLGTDAIRVAQQYGQPRPARITRHGYRPT